jgi:hypothetical protein
MTTSTFNINAAIQALREGGIAEFLVISIGICTCIGGELFV